MSIRIRLKQLHQDGDLLFRPPSVRSKGVTRDVFVSKDVDDFLEGRCTDPSFERAIGRALAKIDSFAAGQKIVFGLSPFGKSPATLVARNKPWQKGVVDLRVASYQPDVRIFGCFSEKDVLILLTWAPKTGLHYGTEVARCRSRWDQLFPAHIPLIGTDHDHYVSNFLPG